MKKTILTALLVGVLAGGVFASPAFAADPLDPGAQPEVPGGETGSATVTAVYALDGGTDTKTGETLSASESDQSAVLVDNGGALTLADMTLRKSGDTSSEEDSNFSGLNAALLVRNGGSLSLSGGSIATSSSGSNAIVVTGSGSTATVDDLTITTAKDSSRGLHATWGGSIVARNVSITTAGAHCAALATDRGGGTVTLTGGTLFTAGEGSPAFYSTGTISASGVTGTATESEAAAIEGRNSITLDDCDVTGAKDWGVMIYQSYSGDAETGTGTFSMTGGSLSALEGPILYSCNTAAVFTLKGVALSGKSGVLLRAAANDRWGTAGQNGADVVLNASGQSLTGNVECDAISTVTINLSDGSVLAGAIDAANTGESVTLKLDASSRWTLTGDSYLTALTNADSSNDNIDTGGHTLTVAGQSGGGSTGGETSGSPSDGGGCNVFGTALLLALFPVAHAIRRR